jgi:quercetin dioxygenase-like cupin family protein
MVESQPRPDWFPIPREGTKGVEGRVLLGRDGLFIANLRFSPGATIDKHSAPWDIDVICISGSGYVSVGDEVEAFRAGQSIRWPRNVDHCLWTDDFAMETIMVERHGA